MEEWSEKELGGRFVCRYRTFHAQRRYLRAYLGETGLGTDLSKLLFYLAINSPCRQRELME